MARNIKIIPSTGIIELSGSNTNTSISVTDAGQLRLGESSNTGSLDITGDLTVVGTVTAQEFKTEFVSASIIYRSGSTKFGDTLDDNHSFTGSLEVTGSLTVSETGSISYITGDKIYIDNTNDGHQIGKLIIDYQAGINPALRSAGNDYIRFNNSILLGGNGDNIKASTNHSEDLYLQHQRSGDFGFRFTTADAGSVMRIDGSGNVGIGTTSPTASLHVTGTSILGGDFSTNATYTNKLRTPSIFSNGAGDSLSIAAQGTTIQEGPAILLDGRNFTIGSWDNAEIDSGIRFNHVNNTPNSDTVEILAASDVQMTISASGAVGIGTTTPSSSLHIKGSTALITLESQDGSLQPDQQWAGFDFKQVDGSQVPTGSVARITAVAKAGNTNFGNLLFQTKARPADSYNDTLFLASNGNVGIGTTSPNQKLQVQGGDVTIRLDQYGDTQSYGFGNPARQNDAAFIKYDGVGNFTGDLHLGVVTSSANVPASEILTIYRSGDVGVGTTTPTAKFEVAGTTRISGVTTIGNQVNFGFGTNGGSITFDATSLALTANSGRGISLRPTNQTSGSGIDITSAGNVGIGTSVPDSKLHIEAEIVNATSPDYPVIIAQSDPDNNVNQLGGSGVGILFKAATNSTASIGASIAAIKPGGADDNTSTELGFFTSDDDETLDERLRIDYEGNVGIGTNNPGYRFHVDSGNNETVAYFKSSDNRSRILISDDDTNVYVIAENGMASLGRNSNLNANNLNVNSSGDVGIGTTNPTLGRLHVVQDSDSVVNGITVEETSGGNTMRLWMDGSTRKINAGGSNTMMEFDTTKVNFPTGNVGIGTTSPSYKLDVSGSGRFYDSLDINQPYSGLYRGDAAFTVTAVSASTPQVRLISNRQSLAQDSLVGGVEFFGQDTNSGTNSLAADIKAISDASWQSSASTPGALTFSTNPPNAGLSALEERMRIDSNGNVGIGTTSPTYQLDIYESGSTQPIRTREASTLYRAFEVNYSNTYATQLKFGRFGEITYDGNGGRMYITNAGSNVVNNFTQFKMGSTVAMHIAGNSNIGIGTTSPSQKLTVEGNISASGDLYSNAIRTVNNGNIKLIPDGTGNLYFGNAGKGMNVYHYSSANDGEYAIWSHIGSRYQITPGQSEGFWVNSDAKILGDLTVEGIVTAQEFHTEFVSASIVYSSGSTKFGDTADDNHDFTGSLGVSGSLSVYGSHSNYAIHIGDDDGQKSIAVKRNGVSMWTEMGHGFIGTTGTDGFSIKTNNTNRFSVADQGRVSVLSGNDFQVNSNTLYVDASEGKVGIGTSTPSSSLHIDTSSPVISLGTFHQYTKIYGAHQADLNTPSNIAHSIVLQSNQTNQGYGFYFRQTNGGGSSRITSGTGGTLNLKSGGFFPTTSGSGVYKHIDVAYTLNGSNGTQTGTGYGIYLNATETSLNGLTSTLMDLRANGTSRFNVLGSGNVGIGTTTPTEKLHVSGNILVDNGSASALHSSVGVTTTAAGSFTLYSVPTGSYDGAFFDYTVKSGSNGRAGSIQALWMGTAVNFSETVTADFGDTSGLSLDVSISGSNMVLTGSCDAADWNIKAIIRSI